MDSLNQKTEEEIRFEKYAKAIKKLRAVKSIYGWSVLKKLTEEHSDTNIGLEIKLRTVPQCQISIALTSLAKAKLVSFKWHKKYHVYSIIPENVEKYFETVTALAKLYPKKSNDENTDPVFDPHGLLGPK